MQNLLPVNMIARVLNMLLENDMFRLFVLAVASVYTGYTLYPVPKFLDNMFYVSSAFKYLILLLVLSASIYPLDGSKTLMVLVVPLFVLALFELMRRYEKLGSVAGALGLSCDKSE